MPTGSDTDSGLDAVDQAAAIDALLDWLEARQFLSTERFVESRVHARAARFGNLRIRQELARHEVALDADQAHRLRGTELDRARAVWERKFGAAAADPAERARQARFLAGRGFSGEVIARLLRDARPARAGEGPSDDD